MEDWKTELPRFVFTILFGLCIYMLGCSAHAAEGGELTDTLEPVYQVAAERADEEGGDADERETRPTVGASGTESREGDPPVTLGITREGAAVWESEDLTIGESEPPTLGTSAGPTIGSSSAAEPVSPPIDYVRYIPVLIAGYICYRCARFIYHVIVDAVW